MKRILLLGRTEVWAHWTVLLTVLFLTVTEGPLRMGLGLLALLLHELGHLFTARGLGYRVRSMELWPFGAALTMDGGAGSLPVSLAGPLCGLTAAAMSLMMLRLLPQTAAVMEPFFLLNLTLSAVNLLPAEPLDGGRALAALLARTLGMRRARRFTAWTGLCLGGGLPGPWRGFWTTGRHCRRAAPWRSGRRRCMRIGPRRRPSDPCAGAGIPSSGSSARGIGSWAPWMKGPSWKAL